MASCRERKKERKDRNPMIWETYVQLHSTMGEQMMKKKKGRVAKWNTNGFCSEE